MKLRICCSVITLLLAFCLDISAQTESNDSTTTLQQMHPHKSSYKLPTKEVMKNKFKKTGKSITKQAKKLNSIDTTFISPNLYNFAFMLEQSNWFERYRLGSTDSDDRQSIYFAPNFNPKIGFYFGWRWIFLGISFDMKDIFGKDKNTSHKEEYVFNLYSSKFGVDLYYRKTGSDFKISDYNNFDLTSSYRGTHFHGFRSKIQGINAYWIFNHRRFSYPAAYSQSTNQRKSCGSFLAGFAYSSHDINFDYTQLPKDMYNQLRPSLKFNNVKYHNFNLSFGYSYNWVFFKNCLLNISLMPAIAYKRSRINNADYDSPKDWTDWVKDINFDLITRGGITWNNSKYYVGSSLVLHTYDYRKEHFSITNSFGSIRFYVGFNFWKKREYRDKK